MRLPTLHSKFTRIFVESPALQPLGSAVWGILFGITVLGVQFAYRLSNIRDVFSKLQILDALKETQRLQYIWNEFNKHKTGDTSTRVAWTGRRPGTFSAASQLCCYQEALHTNS